MEAILFAARLFLSGVFLIAGVGKLLDRKGSVKALKDFGVPAGVAGPGAQFLPWAELAVGVLFLFTPTSFIAAAAAAAIFFIFALALSAQVYRGKSHDCHCFGAIQSEPVSWATVLRNLVFLAVAGGLLIAGPSNQGLDLLGGAGETTVLSLAAVLFGYALAGSAIAIVTLLAGISDRQERMERQLDIMEAVANAGAPVTRDDLETSTNFIPIGAPVPDLALTAPDGERTSLRSIVTDRDLALLIFISPVCHPCESMIPDMNRWAESEDGFDLVLVSSGEMKENIRKFGESLGQHIHLLGEREAAVEMGARWTPTAFVIDRNKTLRSHPAIGDDAIRELASQVAERGIGPGRFYGEAVPGAEALIGSEIPEFELDGIDGTTFRSESVIGKKTLAAFWSTTCPFCIEMIRELRQWQDDKSDSDPGLIVFSDGEASDHQAYRFSAPILLDRGFQVSSRLGMNGTPSAVLIDENGRIASETGVGAEQVWALLGRYKHSPNGNGN